MYSYTWYQWLTFFYFYCLFGWLFESTYVSLRKRHFVNRGFLRLPMLPIYGTGAVMMLWVSIPFRESLFLTWLSGAIGATVLEYVTGAAMEQLFKVRYWDYSDQKFNLHGYICLSSSIAWGFLTILMTHLVHKPVERMLLRIPTVIDVIFVLSVSAVFIYDTVICTREAFAFGQSLEALKKLRQELESIQVQRSLFKMEAEEYLEGAKEELKDRLEERYDQLPETTKAQIAGLRERISAIHAKRSRFSRHILLSNPTATSKRFEKEFRELLDDIKTGRHKS